MSYRYVAQTRIRSSFRTARHGLIEVSADDGDELDVDDEKVQWAVMEHLLPAGHVARKRSAPESEED